MQFLSINDRVRKIKDNEEEINKLVEEYKPFIASCVEKITGRYVRYGEDDELSIALIAFVEAVKSYNIFRGYFLSFARNVIKRRLIDYYRKEKKHGKVVSLIDYYGGEENEERDLSTNQSIQKYADDVVNEYRRLELEELKEELSLWGITFMELVKVSPKHARTREAYGKAIRFLLSRPELILQIKSKRYLPMAEIEKNTGVPRKTLERARKYIITVITIATGDYRYIREYVDWGDKDESSYS